MKHVGLSEGGCHHIVLYSGGMDSFITYRYVLSRMKEGDAVSIVYFKLGHRYEKREVEAVQTTLDNRLINYDETLSLGQIEKADAFIEARNAYLILGALKYIPDYARQAYVWLTVQEDEMSIPDRSAEFLRRMSGVASLLKGKKISVVTPWEESDKADMVSWFLESGQSRDHLLETWSCYSGGDIPCGKCSACVRRFIAMEANGIREMHEVNPRYTGTAVEYIDKASKGLYSNKRCLRILEALDDNFGT